MDYPFVNDELNSNEFNCSFYDQPIIESDTDE